MRLLICPCQPCLGARKYFCYPVAEPSLEYISTALAASPDDKPYALVRRHRMWLLRQTQVYSGQSSSLFDLLSHGLDESVADLERDMMAITIDEFQVGFGLQTKISIYLPQSTRNIPVKGCRADEEAA